MITYSNIEILLKGHKYQYVLFGVTYTKDSIEECKFHIEEAYNWFTSNDMVAY